MEHAIWKAIHDYITIILPINNGNGVCVYIVKTQLITPFQYLVFKT